MSTPLNDVCPNRRPTVWLVHGFNVKDGGAGSIAKLKPYYEAAGFEVKLFRYGWTALLMIFPFTARLLNRRLARLLADVIRPGDILGGHSNGALICKLSGDLGAPIGILIIINGAIDSDVTFAPQIGRIQIWYSPSDKPVTFARILPRHPWGDMGAIGYRGPYDARVDAYNKENGFPVSSKEHSDVFKPRIIDFFAPLIVKKTIEQLSA